MYKRIIVKIGTKVLTTEAGTLDVSFLGHIVDQLVRLREKGLQVVLVTSGAGAAGRELISLNDAKSETVRKQVFTAVGQVKLMSVYAQLFEKYKYHCAQVLATKEDFRDKEHYENMQNCFEALLLDKVIPIVNENDVVATTELMFTDNDELAGFVAKQLKADALIILTSTDGILNDQGETVSEVNVSNLDLVAGWISPSKSNSGRGGMISKFAVAKELSEKGIIVHIVKGKSENIIERIVGGEKTGTIFLKNNI